MIHRGESITDYVLRRDHQLSDAEARGLVLPDNVKARYLEEGANLSTQNKINMRKLAGGRLDAASMRSALLQLDVTEKVVLPAVPLPVPKTFAADTSSSAEAMPDFRGDESEDDVELPEDDAETFLNAVETQDLDEHETLEVFAAILEEKFGKETEDLGR
eukprot:2946850-Pyramimonas_sp.AAC.1